MDKHPVVLPYIKTRDKGQELRYSLRSLKNVENFNGEVYVIGDCEKWFTNIHQIDYPRRHGKPYLDQVNKMRYACLLDDMPTQFIASMDDIYITEPTVIRAYCRGALTDENKSYHKRTKLYTKQKLEYMGLPTADFETHAPMLVDKDKLLETLNVILDDSKSWELQWRSMYGNMHGIEFEYFEDKKTKTSKLKDGAIISTANYTIELAKLFPEPSRYEL